MVAIADHASEVPGCPLARPTSDHVSPAPVTVELCAPGDGPSDATKASSNSFGFAVEKGGVIAVEPVPLTDVVVSMTGALTGAGITDAEGADGELVPMAFVAVTVNV